MNNRDSTRPGLLQYPQLLLFSYLLMFSPLGNTAKSDWTINNTKQYLGEIDRQIVSTTVCNKLSNLRSSGVNSLICKPCPDFTSGADNDELTINRLYRGSFSEKSKKEILVNTAGCEPHYHYYGGAVLLETGKKSTVRKSYFPGFNLEDCIKGKGTDGRHFLVCNEVLQVQGQLIGQISRLSHLGH